MLKLKFSGLSYLYNTETKQALRTMGQPSVLLVMTSEIHLPGKKVLQEKWQVLLPNEDNHRGYNI